MSKKVRYNVTHNLTLQFSNKNTVVPEADNTSTDVNSIRSNLPTKTSATRQISDLESLPPGGPFILNFSNLSYDATENDLRNFFRLHEIVNIVKFEHNRGAGIIEFKDLNGLAAALNTTEKVIFNRPFRLTIGTKEDQARFQQTPNQRSRYQNQQRSTPSVLSDETDNWRVKKPVSMVSNSPVSDNLSNKEKSNWREKQSPRPFDEKPVTHSNVDSAENWRRAKTSQPTVTIHENTAPVERVEPKEAETKKISIFGDAKPVDTKAKDLAIEKKINLMKVAGEDTLKTDSDRSAKTTSWNKKPVSTTPATISTQNTGTADKSVLEWREKTKPIKSDIGPAPSQPEAPVKVPEIVPAPIPATNVWQERMKRSKEASGINTDTNKQSGGVTASLIDQKEVKPDQKSICTSVACPSDTKPVVASTSQPETAPVLQAVTEPSPVTVAPVQQSHQLEKAPGKQRLAVSVNGPCLDMRSRTPHHSMSETASVAPSGCAPGAARAPVAVPVLSAPVAGSTRPPCNVDSPAVYNNAAVPPKSCAVTSQNSWAKGPPKGLRDKTEIHQ